ncbi:MAG: rhodanese-like domain-containing protein [Chitinophagaceae bacterium]|nr:rhodanese-like domain-containing protein [Chitinophagaceae bacterium]
MIRFLTFISYFSFLLMSANTNAQVQSKSFNFVLKTLLSHHVPEISVPAAVKAKDVAVFLDAREPEEYDVSHLPNARFTGYNHFDEKQLNDLPKNTPIIVYCAVGKRSENISERLIKSGFTHVKNLYGGIFEWVNQGQQVYDSNNQRVNKVHAYSRLWGKFLDRGEKVY